MVIALKFDWFFKNAVLFVIGLSNSPIIITDYNYRITNSSITW